MANRWICAAGLGGFSGVALGAASRHLVASDAYATSLIDIASRYVLIHAVILFGIGVLSRTETSRWMTVAGCLFVTGMVAFGGGLTVLAMTGSAWANAATPMGGIAFLLGWLALTVHGVTRS